MNLIGSGLGPITGGEIVEIDLIGPDEEDYTYTFRVYRVIVKFKVVRSEHNLGLISRALSILRQEYVLHLLVHVIRLCRHV